MKFCEMVGHNPIQLDFDDLDRRSRKLEVKTSKSFFANYSVMRKIKMQLVPFSKYPPSSPTMNMASGMSI